MPDTKISAATDIVTLNDTDMVPVARVGSTSTYHATAAEISTYANANLPAATTTTAGVVTPDGATITVGVDNKLHGVAPYNSGGLMDGAPAAGTSTLFARGDHVHASDTSKLSLSGGTLTGALTLAADPAASMQPVTLQYYNAHLPTGLPPSGTAGGDLAGSYPAPTLVATTNPNVGTFQGITVNAKGLVTAATNQSYAPLASPTFTGTVTIPAGASIAGFAPLASPGLTGTPTAPTPTVGSGIAGSTTLATTAYVRNGVTDGGNALAGQIGEFLSTGVASPGIGGPASGTNYNAVTLGLTAGDWEVWGTLATASGGGTVQTVIAGISLTSAVMGADFTEGTYNPNGVCRIASPLTRVSISVTANVYLIGQITYTGTPPTSLYGNIYARRVR